MDSLNIYFFSLKKNIPDCSFKWIAKTFQMSKNNEVKNSPKIFDPKIILDQWIIKYFMDKKIIIGLKATTTNTPNFRTENPSLGKPRTAS